MELLTLLLLLLRSLLVLAPSATTCLHLLPLWVASLLILWLSLLLGRLVLIDGMVTSRLLIRCDLIVLKCSIELFWLVLHLIKLNLWWLTICTIAVCPLMMRRLLHSLVLSLSLNPVITALLIVVLHIWNLVGCLRCRCWCVWEPMSGSCLLLLIMCDIRHLKI